MAQWNAEDYAKNAQGQRKWANEVLEGIGLKSGMRVLDIGCGDGAITAAIAQKTAPGRVVGIDASPEMIKFAQKTHPPQANGQLEFYQMDARKIGLKGPFDLAFSNAALHWVDDQPAVLRGVAALLAPGGRLAFQMGGTGNAGQILAIWDEVAQSADWAPYFVDFQPSYHFLSPDDYTRWLREAGFTPVRVELVEKTMAHKGKMGLKGWLRTTWHPHTDQVPPDLREKLLELVAKTFLERHPLKADGLAEVKMVRLNVEARLG